MEDNQRKIYEDLRNALEYAQSIIDTVRDPLLVLDGDLRVISASKSFYKTFKVSAKISRSLYFFSRFY